MDFQIPQFIKIFGIGMICLISLYQNGFAEDDYGSFYDQFGFESTLEQQLQEEQYLWELRIWAYFNLGYTPDPDDSDGDGFEGKDLKETIQLLIERLSGGQILPDEVALWESILGRLLAAQQGLGPTNYWNPWDGAGFNPGGDVVNPDDGDYADAATILKKLKETAGQKFPGGAEEGPAWGYNGDSPEDWLNNQQGGGNPDDPNDDDNQNSGAGSTDDGSVKGPVEIVDPAYVRE